MKQLPLLIAWAVSGSLHFGACLYLASAGTSEPAVMQFERGESVMEISLLPGETPGTETTSKPIAEFCPEARVVIEEEALIKPAAAVSTEALIPEEETTPPQQRLQAKHAENTRRLPCRARSALSSIGTPGDQLAKGVECIASVTNCPKPRYPRISRERKEEGVVIIRVLISRLGKPARVTLATSSGFPLLDRAALTAVHKAKFIPATRNKLPVDSSKLLRIVFRLEDL